MRYKLQVSVTSSVFKNLSRVGPQGLSRILYTLHIIYSHNI